MSNHLSDPLAHAEVQQARVGRYFVAFFSSSILMLLAFVVSQQQKLSYVQFAEALGALLLFTLISQAALFFGLNLSREQIWKSVSLALVVPLFIVTIGFTVVVFASLYARTMIPTDAMSMQPTLLQ
jgi:cytochrome o ubiquinol oxidase operon protein cyoD